MNRARWTVVILLAACAGEQSVVSIRVTGSVVDTASVALSARHTRCPDGPGFILDAFTPTAGALIWLPAESTGTFAVAEGGARAAVYRVEQRDMYEWRADSGRVVLTVRPGRVEGQLDLFLSPGDSVSASGSFRVKPAQPDSVACGLGADSAAG